MSALTDRIAAEHGHRQTKDGDWECKCGVPRSAAMAYELAATIARGGAQ